MSTVAALPIETPTKGATGALASVSLDAGKKNLLADLKAAAAPVADAKDVTAASTELTLEERQAKFTGDIFCEEQDEPLLAASANRVSSRRAMTRAVDGE